MNYWCEYESIRGITLRAIERAISILSSPPSKDSTYDGLSTNFASIIAEIVCTAQNFPDEIPYMPGDRPHRGLGPTLPYVSISANIEL